MAVRTLPSALHVVLAVTSTVLVLASLAASAFKPTTVYASWTGSVYALDAATGKQKWCFEISETGSDFQHNPRLSNDGTSVMVSDYDTVRSLDAETGHIRWNCTMTTLLSTAPVPMADDSVVFGTWDNVLYRTWPNGTLRWVTQRFGPGGDDFSFVDPAVDEQGVIYHVTYDSDVVAVEPENGTVLWKQWLGYETTSSVALGPDNTVLAVAGGMVVHWLDRSNGRTVRSLQFSKHNMETLLTGTPAVRSSDNVVLLQTIGCNNNSRPGVLALSQQAEMLWYADVLIGWDGNTVTVTNEAMYTTTGYYYYAFNSNGQELWNRSATLGAGSWFGMVPTKDGRLFATDTFGVYAMNAATGAMLWNMSFYPEYHSFTTPVLCPCPPPSDIGRCQASCMQ